MLAICIICTETHTKTSEHTHNHDLHLRTSNIPAGSAGERDGYRAKEREGRHWKGRISKDVSALLTCDIFYECKSLFIRIWFTYLRADSSHLSPISFLRSPFSPLIFTFPFLVSLHPFLPHTHMYMCVTAFSCAHVGESLFSFAVVRLFIHSYRIFIHANSVQKNLYKWSEMIP